MLIYKKNNVNIRTFEEDDINDIVELYKICNFYPYDSDPSLKSTSYEEAKMLYDSLNEDKRISNAIVVTKGNKFIGYAYITISYDRIVIEQLAIIPEEKNKGYGKLLVETIKEIANNEERDIVLTSYLNYNFYGCLGFEQNGIHYKYKHQTPKYEIPKMFIDYEEYKKLVNKHLEEEIKKFDKTLEFMKGIGL